MKFQCRAIAILLLVGLFPAIEPITGAVAATTTSFSYTGAAQTWTVPNGVTSIRVLIKGASGAYTNGGLGESISATLAVTPGETLQINVGQSGAAGNGSTPAPATFGGGGLGSKYGGSGGGASDIRDGAYALANRILVAGGGGGGGTGAGGNAGFISGSSGSSGYSGATGGSGGTQSAGGAGGSGASACGNQSGSAGSLGSGGSGATASAGGSGGGGGYYGGGGGGSGCNDSGGGGGSSFADPIRTSLVTYSNVTTRTNGSVDFTYTIAVQTTVTLTLTDGLNSSNKGTLKTIRATVSSTSGGKITFLANGKRIPGCISRAITSTLDCNWKPSVKQSYELSAIFSPTTNTDIASSTKFPGVVVTMRSGTR